MAFAFSLPHILTQAAASARLKAMHDDPTGRTGTVHSEWDEPTHTAKSRMATHLALPLIGHVRDVETNLIIVVHEHDVAVSGSCEPAWAERFAEPAVKHKLGEILS